MSFVHNPEQLKKKIISIFQNNYSTYLSQVEALWVDDPLPLTNFKDIFLGDATRTKEIKEWPSLAVLSGDVFPVERVEQHRNIMWHTQIYLRTYLRDSNLSKLEKYLDRHLQAQLMMFEEHPYFNLEGLASSFEFMRSEPTNSILPTGASIYIRGLETQWECRHR